MAKLQIGKSPEDLERERAEKERQREEEVQKAALERQEKIIALQKKQKLVKIISIVVFVTLFVSMMTFGIYNIFVKQNLTEEEVVSLARSQVSYFPETALNGYFRDNCEAIFQKYIKSDKDKYKSIKTDPNSVEITRIITINDYLVQAEWEVDVLITENDAPVTNSDVIDKLKRVGFIKGVNERSEIVTTEQATEKVTEKKKEKVTEAPVEQTTEEVASNDVSEEDTSEEITEEIKTEEDTTEEEPTPSADSDSSMQILDSDGNVIKEVAQKDDIETGAMDLADIQKDDESDSELESESDSDTSDNNTDINVNKATVINGEITLEDNNGNTETYYISGKVLMKKGSTYTTRFAFTSPIEYYYDVDEDGKTPIRYGYRLASETSLQSFVRINQTNFEEIIPNESYSFEEIELEDEETMESARIKVDKTLDDLYSGRDTSQDVLLFHQFNTFKGTYVSLDDFKLYKESNGLGFNAYAIYTVQFEGFTYTAHVYITLEKSGTSWVITSLL